MRNKLKNLNCLKFYRVTGLIENHDYEFRVAAENAAGRGPWSSNSDVIRASAPPCKYSKHLLLDIFYLYNGNFT